jgi:predicted thioesterase
MADFNIEAFAGDIKPKATVTLFMTNNELASQDSRTFSGRRRGPDVLSTPNLVDIMEHASSACMEICFKRSACAISVPSKILIAHSVPVPPGSTVTATAHYEGREKNTFKFLVTVYDAAGEIAKGTFWRSIVCKENLENEALLRQKSPAGKIYARNLGLECVAEIHKGSPPSFLQSSNTEKDCRMCYPTRRNWRGGNLPHNSVSRGFHHAVHHGSAKLVKLWLNSGIDLSSYLSTGLYAAVEGGQPKVMQLLMDMGADPLTWHTGGVRHENLLHIAAQGTNNEVVALLLSKGLDPNITDQEYYWSALHLALGHGRSLSKVKLMIDAGANPNNTEDEGWTSLHFAVESGDLEAVQFLIDNGADMEVTTARDTPLMMAVRLGNAAVVKKLLTNGCSPSLGQGRCSAHEWLAGQPVPDLTGPARSLRP